MRGLELGGKSFTPERLRVLPEVDTNVFPSLNYKPKLPLKLVTLNIIIK